MISSTYDFQVHQQSPQKRWCFSQTAVKWLDVLPYLLSVLPAISLKLPAPPRKCWWRSQTCRWRTQNCCWHSQLLPGWWLALPGLSLVLTCAPLVVSRSPICTQIVRWCFHVHLMVTAWVQYTLEFDHPWIQVQQLPDIPRGSLRHKCILLMHIGHMCTYRET